MGIIIAYTKKNKVRLIPFGKVLGLLTINSVINRYLVERVSGETGLDENKAEDFVMECVRDGMGSIKRENKNRGP